MKLLYAAIIAGLLVCNTHADDNAVSPADALWQKLQFAEHEGPQAGATSADERKTNILTYAGNVVNLCDQFIREFPNDKRVWEAKLDRLEFILARSELNDQKPDFAVVEAGVKEIIAAPEANKLVKAQASLIALQLHATALMDTPQPSKLADFEKEYTDFVTANPRDPATRQLPFLRLEVYGKNDPAKATALLKAMADDNNPAIAAEAKRRLKEQEFKSKPLALKFTTVDGKEFDLTRWRGKVVLIDFWATWCGPCRQEIPNVVATFKKLNPKGFEIIGISLDSQKERLLEFTQAKEMTWPQYFDGKGWANEISSNFGVTGIPTMWLVDKKGFVRSTEARANLEKQITDLLAE